MNKFKQFVKDRKSEIITGVSVASAVLVAVAVASNASKKDEVRFKHGAQLDYMYDTDTKRLSLTFINPDGSKTPKLNYRMQMNEE